MGLPIQDLFGIKASLVTGDRPGVNKAENWDLDVIWHWSASSGLRKEYFSIESCIPNLALHRFENIRWYYLSIQVVNRQRLYFYSYLNQTNKTVQHWTVLVSELYLPSLFYPALELVDDYEGPKKDSVALTHEKIGNKQNNITPGANNQQRLQGQQQFVQTADILGLGELYKSSSPSITPLNSSSTHTSTASTPTFSGGTSIPGIIGCTSLSYRPASRLISDSTRSIISSLLSINYLIPITQMNLCGKTIFISENDISTPLDKMVFIRTKKINDDTSNEDKANIITTEEKQRLICSKLQYKTKNNHFCTLLPQSELERICNSLSISKESSVNINRSILLIYDDLLKLNYGGIKSLLRLFREVIKMLTHVYGSQIVFDTIPFASASVLEKVTGVSSLFEMFPTGNPKLQTCSENNTNICGIQKQDSNYIQHGVYGVNRAEFHKFTNKLINVTSQITSRSREQNASPDMHIWLPMLNRFEIIDTSDILNIIEYHQLISLSNLLSSKNVATSSNCVSQSSSINIANSPDNDELSEYYSNTVSLGTSSDDNKLSVTKFDRSDNYNTEYHENYDKEKTTRKWKKQLKKQFKANRGSYKLPSIEVLSDKQIVLPLTNIATNASFTKPKILDSQIIPKSREFFSSILFPRYFPFTHVIQKDNNLLSLQYPLPHVPPNTYEHTRLSSNEKKIIKATLIQHIIDIGKDSDVELEAPSGDIYTIDGSEFSYSLVNTLQVDNIVELSGASNLVSRFKILHSLLVPPGFLV